MTDPDRAMWNGMLAELRTQHPGICRHWFEELVPLGVDGGALRVLAMSDVHRDYLRSHCLDSFNDALQSVSGRLLSVRFVGPRERDDSRTDDDRAHTASIPGAEVLGRARSAPSPASPGRTTGEPSTSSAPPTGLTPSDSTPPSGPPNQADRQTMTTPSDTSLDTPGRTALPRRAVEVSANHDNPPARPAAAPPPPPPAKMEPPSWPGPRDDALVINPDYTFDSFIVGPSNRLAHAAALAVAANPGMSYNPLFTHGGVGLGKTHLLQAISLRIHEADPNLTIYYLSCESFMTQFMEAVQAGKMSEFRHRFRDVDVLIVDDIHFLAKGDTSQEEFFHTFNTLHHANKQIVISSDAPPEDIPHLEERLVSRFKWGLVASVDPPRFETRVEILKSKSRIRGIRLPQDVADFVAERVDSNIRELEGALTQLQMRSAVENRPLDLNLAREALGARADGARPQAPTLERIIEAITDYFGVRLADLQSKRRHRSITQPRQVCMFLARKLTRHSLEEIGGYFGGRDHTTVMHAIKAVEQRKVDEPEFARVVESLENRLQADSVG